MNPFQGQLLIASPSLQDPNFAKTVVLIVVHNEEGTLGLTLNRETAASLQEIWEQVSDSPCSREELLRQGGPVGETLMAIHTNPLLADFTVNDELFVATEKRTMEQVVASDQARAVFVIGHAGWGPGQLDMECEEGAWLAVPATPGYVFGQHEALWEDLLKEAGQRKLMSLFKLKAVPDDPSVN
jgi:putative transcriptional regulator